MAGRVFRIIKSWWDSSKSLLSLGTTFTVIFLSTITALFLYIAGLFYPPIFSYFETLHFFEIAICCILLELLYLHLKEETRSHVLDVFETENDVYPWLLDSVLNIRPSSVDILSAGLSSRYQFVVSLLKNQIPVRILIQGKECAVDDVDSTRVHSFIDLIKKSCPRHVQKFLEVRSQNRVVSLRAIIVRYGETNHDFSIISWFTYDLEGTVIGHIHPCIFAKRSTKAGRYLLNFVCDDFDKSWESNASNIIHPTIGIR